MTTRKMTVTAMLVAVYVVLSNLTPIKLINFKFTLEAFPVLVAGILFGPLEGLVVGGVGSLIYQLVFSGYGFTATTLLWVLPHAVNGLLAGLLSRWFKEMNFLNCLIISLICNLSVTLLNTLALYVDSRLFGYYTKALVFGSLLLKFGAGIILAGVYAGVLPVLIAQLKKTVH